MSEDHVPSTTNSESPLRYEEVVRFFQEFTLNKECQSCSAVAWVIPVDDIGGDGPVTLANTGIYKDGAPDKAILLCCQNCGFYRSHRAQIVREWLNKNPKKLPDNNE